MATKFKPLLVRFTPERYKRLKKWAQKEKLAMAHALSFFVDEYCTDFEND